MFGVLPMFPHGKVQLQPAAPAAVASALHWVPYAPPSGASWERPTRTSGPVCSHCAAPSAGRSSSTAGIPLLPPPFAECKRFPEEELFVCADRPPLAQALQAVNRAMMQVAVKDASHDSCDHYYDAVAELMCLLVDDKGAGRAVFDQTAFESAFQLECVQE